MQAGQHAEQELRDLALTYPESHEDFPWGSRAIKVRGKIFFSVNVHDDELVVSMKLPDSSAEALLFEFTEPTHYGMGKYGWVTARWPLADEPPFDLVAEWLDESYRAIAPKKLVKELDAMDDYDE